jgi:pyrrolidone-carboxylate peptidase
MRKNWRITVSGVLLAASSYLALPLHATQYTELTVEEQRIVKAQHSMPEQVSLFGARVQLFQQHLLQARNYTALTQLMLRHGNALWQEAVLASAERQDYDDRALYWARLQMTKALRQSPEFKTLLSDQQAKLVWQFELLSRGSTDVKFDRRADKKILLTGFDPFLLDTQIEQSNPSGAIALALDDLTMSVDGQSVEIETLIMPVRFSDFDLGIVEQMLTPWLQNHQIDLLVTISMGRDDFDLERFPGRRRSSIAPDNLNVMTGATKQQPQIPLLNHQPLAGPEFVEFSLPASAMMNAMGPYQVRNNNQVTTLTKTFAPQSLAELADQIAVQGSGGGYLSNEISYRSLVLRNKFMPMLPAGHIHTPRVVGFSAQQNKAIAGQVKALLAKAVSAL